MQCIMSNSSDVIQLHDSWSSFICYINSLEIPDNEINVA